MPNANYIDTTDATINCMLEMLDKRYATIIDYWQRVKYDMPTNFDGLTDRTYLNNMDEYNNRASEYETLFFFTRDIVYARLGENVTIQRHSQKHHLVRVDGIDYSEIANWFTNIFFEPNDDE